MNNKPKSLPRGALILASVFALTGIILLTAGLVPILRSAMDPLKGRIAEGVYAYNMDLSGLTPSQAEKFLDETVAVKKNTMAVTLGDSVMVLPPKLTGASLDTAALVEEAYSYGRTKPLAPVSISLKPYVALDSTAIRTAVESWALELGEPGSAPSYSLVGQIPTLDESSILPTTPCPQIAFTAGKPGYDVDVEGITAMILDAFDHNSYRVDASALVTLRDAILPDFQAAYAELCVAPVNARLENRQAIPGSYGLQFDPAEAERLLKEALPGETIHVPMELVAPDVAGDAVYFADVLGFCQTPHSNNENRNNNLRLACQALNGIVLQPGESLSYNATLGQRTEERGFLPAPAYSGVNLVDVPGGGICQVSSTLYLCSLFAEVTVLERVSHGYPSTYMPIGLDATVSWGAPDLKICNEYPFPIQILAENTEDFVRVWIMGLDNRNYTINVGFTSSSDRYARSFIYKYDKETGDFFSKEEMHLSAYLENVESQVGKIAMDEVYIGGAIRKQAIGSPSQETLDNARIPKKANLNADT